MQHVTTTTDPTTIVTQVFHTGFSINLVWVAVAVAVVGLLAFYLDRRRRRS